MLGQVKSEFMDIVLLDQSIKAPEYKTDVAAGLDIYLPRDITITLGVPLEVNLGFKAAVPEGYACLLVPRSSTGTKKGLYLRNTLGVIDSDYRGEWMAKFCIDENEGNIFGDELKFKKGDRLIQGLLVPVLHDEIRIVTKLPETKRGDGGFGSTGK